MFNRVFITELERAFVYVDGAFARFLTPGRYTLVYPFQRVAVRRVPLAEPGLAFPDAESLVTRPEVAREVVFARVSDTQRGLLFRGGNFAGFLAPGFHAFLKLPGVETKIELVDATGLEIVHPLRDVLARAPGAAPFLRVIDVADGFQGVLYVDHVRARTLAPGRYLFWNGLKELQAAVVDVREQTLEVQGQELMTQDKVSLRVNLTARFKVVDLAKVLDEANWREMLYRELQLALRDEVGTRTLDALLTRKDEARAAIVARVAPAVEAIGVRLIDAGLRDVILPGEMRTIFNQVIEAEKRAEASLIARREETAATRNLLNTAKLLESNPVLLKLKELETTEKIAEKIGSLSVVGGLDGLLKALAGGVKLGP